MARDHQASIVSLERLFNTILGINYINMPKLRKKSRLPDSSSLTTI